MKFKTHEEVHDEKMKNWRYRFWWYLFTPYYFLARLAMKIKGRAK